MYSHIHIHIPKEDFYESCQSVFKLKCIPLDHCMLYEYVCINMYKMFLLAKKGNQNSMRAKNQVYYIHSLTLNDFILYSNDETSSLSTTLSLPPSLSSGALSKSTNSQ